MVDQSQIRTLERQLKLVREPYKSLCIFNEEEEKLHLTHLIVAEELKDYERYSREAASRKEVLVSDALMRVAPFGSSVPCFDLDFLKHQLFLDLANYAIEKHNQKVLDRKPRDADKKYEPILVASGILVLEALVYAHITRHYFFDNYYIVLVARNDCGGTLGAYETKVTCERYNEKFKKEGYTPLLGCAQWNREWTVTRFKPNKVIPEYRPELSIHKCHSKREHCNSKPRKIRHFKKTAKVTEGAASAIP